MNDLVERLRMQGMDSDMQDTAREAADEIERLQKQCVVYKDIADQTWEQQAEIERLRAALTDLRERSVEEGVHHFVTRIDAALTTGTAGKRGDV